MQFEMPNILRWAMVAATVLPSSGACKGVPFVIAFGVEDNFKGPPKPVSPSVPLRNTRVFQQFAKGHLRRFDEDGEDLLFATSLPLPARKICDAVFEIRVRRRTKNGLSWEFNDYLLVGFAPFGSSGLHKVLFKGGIWAGDPPELTVKTARIPLPAIELNRFILLTPAPHVLDIEVHDDTSVDYTKLVVRFE